MDITWRTFARALLIAIGIWAWLKIWPLALVLLVAIVMAVTFDPPIVWLEKRKIPRVVGVLLVGITVLGFLAFVGFIVAPSVEEQMGAVTKHLQTFAAEIHDKVPSPFRRFIPKGVDAALPADASDMGKWVLGAGQALLELLAVSVFGFVLTLYLLADGRRVYAWLVSYVPRSARAKLQRTNGEISSVIFAYIAGQLLTSAACAIYAFVVLTILKVPAALVLALLAGIFDILPIAGFIAAVIPAILMGLTVSPWTPLGVFGLYLLYHAIENYLIVPHVYGNRLRLSTLTVFVSLALGAAIAGIVGALLVLPLVAAFPIIERHWLTGWFGTEAIADHIALDESGSKKDVVNHVIEGV